MKTWIWVGLAIIVIGSGAFWWMQQVNNTTTHANPIYTETPLNTSGTALKTIEIPTYHISLQVPQDWTVGTEHWPYAGDVGVLPLLSPQDPTYTPSNADCPTAGCSRYAISISATTKWPHDPKVYRDYTEPLIDGTAGTFQHTLSLTNGSSQRVGADVTTKVKNMKIGGADAVLVNTHTAPDVGAGPFSENVIWIRKNDMNWYIYLPDDYVGTASVYDRIFATIKLTE